RRLRRDARDAKGCQIVRADRDAADSLRRAVCGRDDELGGRAVAYEALVLDPAGRGLRARMAERPTAEYASECERQDQRQERPADALIPPFESVKAQLSVQIFRSGPAHAYVLRARLQGTLPREYERLRSASVKIETISVRVGRDIEAATGEVAP